jgi:flagella basal body P-ring formation protein FlgA
MTSTMKHSMAAAAFCVLAAFPAFAETIGEQVERRLAEETGAAAAGYEIVIDWSKQPDGEDGLLSSLRYDRMRRRFEAVAEMRGGQQSISGFVRAETDIPVPVRQIAAKETLRPEDLTTRRIDMLTSHAETITDPDLPAGQQSRRSLKAGAPMLRRDLREIPAVERNDRVEMVYAFGPVELHGVGKALQSGKIGDIIRIQNTDSKKIIQGSVTGPGQVLVGAAGTLKR